MKYAKTAKRFEMPDPLPVSISAGLKKPPTLEETISRVLRDHKAQQMLHGKGVDETPDEAEDFDIPDDPITELTRFEFAAEAVPFQEMRSRLQAAFKEKPSLQKFLKKTLGHLFRPGELPEEDATPPPAPKPVPKKEDPPSS